MAVAFGHRSTNIALDEETIDSTIPLNGDKAITEATIRRVIEILESVPGVEGMLDPFKPPYDALTCATAYRLFCEIPFVIKVPDELNRSPNDSTTIVVWERWIDITDTTTTAFLNHSQLAALRAKRVTRIPIATVSTSAWESMERHVKSLLRNLESRKSEYEPLLENYSNDNSSCCCCTIC
ncbi:uncharacterized protein TRIADDRAFT_60524 [Trichoplax adhaerens]|uniref:Uncharacterized protein n=1 Tax=Trichoplax adhaerens TaxID=10228 RepID=B3S8F6_TRIAD|nr:predicted protein [Trichoplax adhaerens]EDV20878.1 predicted protein [Trichoplax adhaerens]|eukprot:XP_002116522.1 predicted protein [Trichoplax adhaerens]